MKRPLNRDVFSPGRKDDHRANRSEPSRTCANGCIQLGRDQLPLSGVRELARELKDGTYTPEPVRQVLIPKKQPGKLRPLGNRHRPPPNPAREPVAPRLPDLPVRARVRAGSMK